MQADTRNHNVQRKLDMHEMKLNINTYQIKLRSNHEHTGKHERIEPRIRQGQEITAG